MKSHNSFRLLFSLCFAALLFAACTAAPTPTPIPTPSPTAVPPTSTPLPTATETPLPSVTPVPTATPTTAPTATNTPVPDTTVVFTDDFAPPCHLWLGDSQNAAFKCENGEYTILVKRAESSQPIWYGVAVSSDTVIEVDAHAISGPPYVLYGVVFGVSSDGKHYYLFALNRDGRYSLYHWDYPKWANLIAPTRSGAINPDTAMNHLKIVAQGNQIALYANNQWLNTVTDSTLPQGRFGFYVSDQDPNGKAGFSNLRVSKINNALVLPAGVPVAQPTVQASVPAVVPSVAPTVASKYPLPPGKGGLVVRNFYGQQANFTIANQLYVVPANGEVFIVLDPGTYQWSSSIPGVGVAHGTATIVVGQIFIQQFASQP